MDGGGLVVMAFFFGVDCEHQEMPYASLFVVVVVVVVYGT